ncbi:hypothetical protein BaRGS_00010363 [Batillaria attramentaria]|uniref:Uncharacterized protein n=1 Tax=Batillaria attramentaria TaxID=370345 RepID=A0ABD0J3E1_9CAEN
MLILGGITTSCCLPVVPHIRTAHRLKPLWSNSASRLPSTSREKTKYPANSPRAKDITQKLAIFIVKDLRPYTLVENKQFRSLLAALDERYQCPSRD